MSASVQCDFCAFHCRIPEGESGHCGVRVNEGGRLRTLCKWQLVGPQTDPVEKKPLYHFLPGSPTFSIAQFGCNFRCQFCQNYQLMNPGHRPADLGRRDGLEELLDDWRLAGRPPVAFTYSEPAVWQDMLLEVAGEVRREGGLNIAVSNGFYGQPALDRLMNLVDAFNIDYKGSDDFYKRLTGGRQKPVLETIRALATSPDHVLEVTTLLIEGEHSRDEIFAMADQLTEAGVQVWHLSLFHPAYRMAAHPPTSADFALDIIDELRSRNGIPHLYLGNSRMDSLFHTSCAYCGADLIRRRGYHILENRVETAPDSPAGRCPDCGGALYGRYN